MHGDLWANNVMFSTSDKPAIVDWQCLATANPMLDFGNLAFLSMDWPETEANLEDFVSTYYEALETTCKMFGDEVKLPWKDVKEYESRLLSEGTMVTFLWSVTAYQNAERYPNMKKRIFGLFRKALEHNQEMFKDADNK